jgi:hypothetical protein
VGSTQARDKRAEHWKQLGLMSGAPECVIKAAHRFLIEIHHPDRGGSVEQAQRVNVAYDELKGQGSKPNEHVAAYFEGEPWHVIGVASNADRRLVERAGKTLAAELHTHPRLAARVEWAIENFGRPGTATAPPRPRSAPAPRRRAAAPAARPREAAAPGLPDGLVDSIDFGTLEWGSTLTREIRLTWRQFAPYKVDVDAAEPVSVTVTGSKTLPGRFVIAIGIDWTSELFSGGASVRGHTMSSTLRLRWAGGGEAVVRVKGVLLHPALVSASPESLDLGAARLRQPVRASLVLVSSAPASVKIDASAWLARVDGRGEPLDTPLKLQANVPVRVAFDVQWDPIAERAATVAAGRPVRPTGRITVRWNDGELEVPVQIVVQRPG